MIAGLFFPDVLLHAYDKKRTLIMITNATLHHVIMDHMLNKGYAPDLAELCRLTHAKEASVVKALKDLEEYHGVVLHPHSSRIWVIHPFSNAPTNFYVESDKRGWWGNCAWCSLGIAALVNKDAKITSSFGAHGDPAVITIQDGQIKEGEFLVHFPIPMKEAWDNVIYTCSTMLLFRDKQEIRHWCAQHHIAEGDIQPVSKVWQLARIWYGKHMDTNWEKWTAQEAQQIFWQCSLHHPVWQLEESAIRF